MDVHPSGPGPEVPPNEPYDDIVPLYEDTESFYDHIGARPTNVQDPKPDFEHKPDLLTSIPRRTKLHSMVGPSSKPLRYHHSATCLGKSKDFRTPTQESLSRQTWSPDKFPESPIYGCLGKSSKSVMETKYTQLQEQVHQLRITEKDLLAERNKVWGIKARFL